MRIPYWQVDVFSDKPLAGNPLVVFFVDSAIANKLPYAALARETNLSETAFILPPEVAGDYHLRIFTPRRELPFSGHPSLGSAFAYTEYHALYDATVIQESLNQSTTLWRKGSRIAMNVGMGIAVRPVDPSILYGLFHLDLGGIPEVASTGLSQLLVPLHTHAELEDLALDPHLLSEVCKNMDVSGAYFYYVQKKRTIFARFFSPQDGILEDPATGSAAGALAVHLKLKANERLTIHQGLEIQRPSTIYVEQTQRGIVVSGDVVKVSEGSFEI